MFNKLVMHRVFLVGTATVLAAFVSRAMWLLFIGDLLTAIAISVVGLFAVVGTLGICTLLDLAYRIPRH